MTMQLPGDLAELEIALLESIAALKRGEQRWPAGSLDRAGARNLFQAQVSSRILDHTARWLRYEGVGYYTIASAGHEGNAAVALGLRLTDPALLHYRSGGFYMARASQADNHDAVGDVLRGMLAKSTEPMAGGRHKVFGHYALNVIPQTSTIASHVPRAVGLALSFERSAPNRTTSFAPDSIAVCSIGDASLNHSTTQGALNWAAHSFHSGKRVPLLVVIEDNGFGISVRTPEHWVATSTQQRAQFIWDSVDGRDPADVLSTTAEIAAEIRATGQPGLLQLKTTRYLGHAGADAEAAYRTPGEIKADYALDPIVGTARLLVQHAGHKPGELIKHYLDRRRQVRRRAKEISTEPELLTAREIMEPLSPRRPVAVATRAKTISQPPPAGRKVHRVAGAAADGSLTLAQTINHTLGQVLSHHPQALIFGEDVGRKGGVYGVTRGLQRTFGERQVFDTLLDEQSILGMALGTAVNGFLPIPEIQYLAYLHNAEDQLRGEAATLSFFSRAQYTNPMVVRVAGYAYQQGFGGHFHNDNSVAVLRDIPGLIIASPSHPSDAGPMLRSCVGAGLSDGNVSVFLEPIARYHTVDLLEEGDAAWLAKTTDRNVPIGMGRTHGDGSDLTIISWANGAYMSRRAQHVLAEQHAIQARVLDLRWLAPLPIDDILREANATGRVVVADETRLTGGVGDAVIAALVQGAYRGELTRVSGQDSLIPLGAAAEHVLISEDDIIVAAQNICR